jgi:BirA family biotin operon repressor/biotin-[acetyl-CoA-carboxylase] ligase
MKSKILSLFSTNNGIVSGETFSKRLGVSRVAVWKHIRQLQAAGYAIEATSKGYRLLEKSDTPYPWNFGDLAEKVHYYPTVTSTMARAVELARDGCADFSVVVADVQTQGRGRLQRKWQSDAGGLYFTLVIRPGIPPGVAPLLNLAAAVDLACVLKQSYGIDAQLKWPNDVLVDGAKIAGILSLMEAESDLVNFVALGIGININTAPGHLDQPVTSLCRLIGRSTSRSEFLKAFLELFHQRLARDFPADVIAEWKQLSSTLGQRVEIHTTTCVYEGIAVDIEASGALVIKTAHGDMQSIVFGDCFYN